MTRAPHRVALAAALLAACNGDPSQIQVIVDAEPGVRAQTHQLHVRIFGGDADSPPEEYVERYSVPATIDFAEWPRTFALTPQDNDPSRQYLVEATALREDGSPVAVARILSGYRPGRTLRVVMFLFDACIGVPCEELDETCDPQLRMCTDARRDSDDLEEIGRDAALPDGGVGTDGCTADADCDDGVDCTEDLCIGSRCTRSYRDEMCADAHACTDDICLPSGCSSRAVDTRCDDSVDCTVDTCDEATGCVFTPDDGRCTAGPDGRCDPATDCQYSSCEEGVTCNPGPCRPDARCLADDTCDRPSLCEASETCCADTCVAPGCDDGNPCTDDSCGAAGCVNTPRSGASCSDGDACTIFDYCDAAGACVPGAPCDDANPCTMDVCGGTSCSHPFVANGTPCGSPTGCGIPTCQSGTCVPSVCMDGGVTTDAGRDAGTDGGDACGGCGGGEFCCDVAAVCCFTGEVCTASGCEIPDAGVDGGDACGGCGGGELCCEITATCCLTGEICTATGCELVDAGVDGGDACGGCGATEICCEISSECCSMSETCTASGCQPLDSGGPVVSDGGGPSVPEGGV